MQFGRQQTWGGLDHFSARSNDVIQKSRGGDHDSAKMGGKNHDFNHFNEDDCNHLFKSGKDKKKTTFDKKNLNDFLEKEIRKANDHNQGIND